MAAFGRVDGVVAQLVERLVRNEKVAGSIPVGSTSLVPFASPLLSKPRRCLAVVRVDPRAPSRKNTTHHITTVRPGVRKCSQRRVTGLR